MILSSTESAVAQVFDQFVNPNVAGTGVEPEVNVLSRRRPDYDYPGLTAGALTIRPELKTSTGYYSNVLGSEDPKGSPFIETSGVIDATSNWSSDSLGATLSFNDTQYLDLPNQSTLNWTGATQGYIQLGRNLMTLGFKHEQLNQTPRDLDTPQLDSPINFTIDTFRAGYTANFNRLTLTPQLDVAVYRFENGFVGGVPFPQTFRDRTTITPALIATYELAPLRRLVGVVRNAVADYTDPAPGAVTRNYNDTTVLGGFDYDGGSMVRLRVLLGYEIRSFTSASLKTIQAPVAEATVIYNLSGLTTITGTVARQVADSAQEVTTGLTETFLKLTLDHEYLRNVILQAHAAATIDEYSDNTGHSALYSSGLSVTWLLNRHVRLSATYDAAVRNASSANGGNYLANQYMVQLSFGF